MKYSRSIALASLTLFGLVACGDDETGSGATGTTGSTSAATTTGSTTATGTGGATTGSGGGSGGEGGEGTTTGQGGSGGATGQGGSGGGSGLPFGSSCVDDADCESGLCFPFNNGGPKCTILCPPDQMCPPPSSGCNNMQPAVCKVN